MTSEQQLAATLGIPYSIAQVPVGPYTINYLKAGSGPPLVLLHGANFGWGVWYPNIPALAEHRTVYAIDLPGAGRSTRVNYAHLDPHKDLLDIVTGWTTAMDIPPFDVVGCSIGGWIAMMLALQYPAHVKKLIILNSVGLTNYMGAGDRMIGCYPLARLIAKTALRPVRSNKNIERFLRGIFYRKDIALRPEFVEYFYETMATSHNLLFISRLTALEDTFLLEQQLNNILHETLIVWGKQDRIIPLKKNEPAFSRLPRASVRIIDDAGHIPSLEQPQIFNECVRSFLITT